MISQKVLDMSATQDKSATLHTRGDGERCATSARAATKESGTE